MIYKGVYFFIMSGFDYYKKDTELRHMKPGVLFELSKILELQESWKSLMTVIPTENDFSSRLKYTGEDIRLIEEAALKQRKCASEILIEEWSTSGIKRPTFGILLECLMKLELYRAADYITTILIDAPKRIVMGPSCMIDVEYGLKEEVSDEPFKPSADRNEEIINNVDYEDVPSDSVHSVQFKKTTIYNDNNSGTGSSSGSCVKITEIETKKSIASASTTMCNGSISEDKCSSSYPTVHTVVEQKRNENYPESWMLSYELIKTSTNDFSEKVILGSGAFGTVYFGVLENHVRIAAKVLRNIEQGIDLLKQFRAELEILTRCNHKNILQIIGVCESPVPCIVYRFMPRGTLQDRIARKTIYEPLDWKTRITISSDVADGLQYLHFGLSERIVHRDIKSANILLDSNDVAKIGDFGLVRSNPSKSTINTETIVGTTAYMSPEAFRGDVSIQMDVYSFGVVLLELITGLEPYDESRDGIDIITYLDNVDSELKDMVDPHSGNWNTVVLDQIISLSEDCLKEKRNRPFINDVYKRLQNMIQFLSLSD